MAHASSVACVFSLVDGGLSGCCRVGRLQGSRKRVILVAVAAGIRAGTGDGDGLGRMRPAAPLAAAAVRPVHEVVRR